MPLIIFAGFPASGKTTRAKEVKDYLQKDFDRSVNLISDHSIGVERNKVYEATLSSAFVNLLEKTVKAPDSKKEKEIRGTLKSSVQRDLNKDTVTILDSLNYIKGFRYELYCVTKECQTTHCVIHCDTSAEDVAEWNMAREESEQYSPEILNALIMRFEAPKPNNRWDSPLFVIQKDDILPFEAISDAIFKRKAPPPNASTLPQPLSSTNFLYKLDRITKDILDVIMEGQKMSVPGDQIGIPGASDKITLTRTLTLAELQRNRRQFITYTKMHPVDDATKLSNMFVQYLNNTLR